MSLLPDLCLEILHHLRFETLRRPSPIFLRSRVPTTQEHTTSLELAGIDAEVLPRETEVTISEGTSIDVREAKI